jgi:murein DD-endopeptidase MepM/ murein hydrolase activator NlpD
MTEAAVETLQCGTSEARADTRRSVGRATARTVSTSRRMRTGKRAVTVSRPALIVLGVIAGVFCAVFVCLAGNFSNILLKQIRDAYILYRVTNERDALKASLRQMEEEVVSLRIARSREQLVDNKLTQQVAALKDVVSMAGSLGLLDRVEDKKGRHGVFAFNDTRHQLRDLAEALTTGRYPRSSEGAKQVAQLRELNDGLGGAEVECRRNKLGKVQCEHGAVKRPVSFKSDSQGVATRPPHEAFSAIATGSFGSESERLGALEAISQVTQALRLLPIGSPVAGRLSSGFGHRHSPFVHRTSFHEGVDISLARGGSVLATADGRVTKVDFDGTYGWVVDVAHTPHLVTRYAHLSRPLVKEGTVVERGDKIALSGSTGRSTGPHLHYEVRYKDVARDPKPFLALADRLRSFS